MFAALRWRAFTARRTNGQPFQASLHTSFSPLKPRYTHGTPLQRYSALPPSPPPPPPRKLLRRTSYILLSLTGLGTLGYVLDAQYNARAISRNVYTLYTCAAIALDYKLNFQPGAEYAEGIPKLHERVAERVYKLLTNNGGLYIKIGQAIGANPGVLPTPFQTRFASLFDDAPQIPFAQVLEVFQSQFNRPPDGPGGVFEIFEKDAIASASLAQVHRARTWAGEWVAVKVQKPDVGKQVEWDLAAYALVMHIYEHYLFHLPVSFIVPFVSDRLRAELDFELEASNADRTRALVEGDSRLRDRVYVPKVYHEYTTPKIMTAEWIDGVRLSDRAGVRRLMGEKVIVPNRERVMGEVRLSPAEEAALLASTFSDAANLPLPFGLDKPLKGGVKSVMETMVELFSAQIFEWGWVHCDPHPGNVLIRPRPVGQITTSSPLSPTTTTYSPPPLTYTAHPQLVLLDHGLYVSLPPSFRHSYARLWKALFTMDGETIREVAEGWGIGREATGMFASATLLKPVRVEMKGRTDGMGEKEAEEGPKVDGQRDENGKEVDHYEMSVIMKERLRAFLKDTDRLPRPLFFLARNMRMVQGNNQSLGSPVNRVKIMALGASRALAAFPDASSSLRYHPLSSDPASNADAEALAFPALASSTLSPSPPSSPLSTLRTHLSANIAHIKFLVTLLTLDLLFSFSKARQWARGQAGVAGEGWEDELERGVRRFAKGYAGVEVEKGVFDG